MLGVGDTGIDSNALGVVMFFIDCGLLILRLVVGVLSLKYLFKFFFCKAYGYINFLKYQSN